MNVNKPNLTAGLTRRREMIKKAPTTTFDTELFKRSVLYNVKTLYRKTLEEATDQQIFQAVSYAVVKVPEGV